MIKTKKVLIIINEVNHRINTKWFISYVFLMLAISIIGFMGCTTESVETILWEEAKKLGFSFFYVNDYSGHPRESTFCPDCEQPIILRKAGIPFEKYLDINYTENLFGVNCRHCQADLTEFFTVI